MSLSLRFLSRLLAYLTLASHALMAHDPHDPMTVVAVSPNFTSDQTLLVATGEITVKLDLYVLLQSTDGGTDWSVCSIPTNQPMSAIVFSPAYSSDGTIFVAGTGGLFRSTDHGASWSPLETSPLPPGTAVSSVALSPSFNYNTTSRTLFVAASNRIFESANGGMTWTKLPAQPAPLTSKLTVLAVSPNYTVDHTLLAGSSANGVFESTNGGSSWTLVTSGLSASVTALAFSPAYASDRTIFAGTFGAGIWISRTGGVSGSWATVSLSDNSVTGIALSQTYSNDGTLWATTADKSGNNGGVFQSSNRGTSWTGPQTVSRQLASNQTNIHYLSVAAGSGVSGSVVYLGMYEGLWKLPPNGTSWQYIDALPTRLVRHINLNSAANQTVFANTYGGGNLWSSTPGTSWDVSWTFQNTGMPLSYTDASGLSPNFAADGIAFSGVISGLQETTNGNAARPVWAVVQGGLPAIYPRSLAISPNFASDQTLFVGTTTQGSSGLWRSTNGGLSWTHPSSLAGPAVVSIALSPAFTPSNGTAFATSDDTSAGGIYKSIDGGSSWQRITTLAQAPMDGVAVSSNYPNDQTVLAAYATGGVMESNDGGVSWTAISGLTAIRALDIQFSPNYAIDQTFYIGTLQEGLLRSTGGALTPASLQDNLVTAVALTPNFNYSTGNQILFAASYHGIYQSLDGGSTWTDTKEPARNEESRSSTDPATKYAPPTITYGNASGGPGNWASITSSQNASTDHWMKTTVSGDTAVLSFVGSSVVWVSRIGPNEGTATVELNGSQYSVNLTNSSNQFQYPVWESPSLLCGLYTLTLTATPQSGKEVSIDTFDVSNVNCPFVSPIN